MEISSRLILKGVFAPPRAQAQPPLPEFPLPDWGDEDVEWEYEEDEDEGKDEDEFASVRPPLGELTFSSSIKFLPSLPVRCPHDCPQC